MMNEWHDGARTCIVYNVNSEIESKKHKKMSSFLFYEKNYFLFIVLWY